MLLFDETALAAISVPKVFKLNSKAYVHLHRKRKENTTISPQKHHAAQPEQASSLQRHRLISGNVKNN